MIDEPLELDELEEELPVFEEPELEEVPFLTVARGELDFCDAVDLVEPRELVFVVITVVLGAEVGTNVV